MKKILLSGISLLLLSSLMAQQPSPPVPLRERIFFGGSIGGLSFSSQGTYIDISPIVGYRVTEKFAVGLGPIYQYMSNRYYNYKANNFGGKLFARHTIWRSLFAHAEYEVLRINYRYTDPVFLTPYSFRKWVGSKFVGGGINQPLGGHSFFSIMLLYNLNQTPNSPRPDPLHFSMGFGIGL